MVSRTRRALLQGAAALSLGLAGCSGATSSSTTVTASNRLNADNAVLEPDHVTLRRPEPAPIVWFDDELPASPDATPDDDHRITDAEAGLIADESTAAELRFADVDGVDDARAFVDGTDFETETLVLEATRVPECYRLELCGATWSATDYHTYYGRVLRPADVACETDAWDRVAHLIRLPATLDPAEVTGRGSGTSGSGCGGFRRRYEEGQDS